MAFRRPRAARLKPDQPSQSTHTAAPASRTGTAPAPKPRRSRSRTRRPLSHYLPMVVSIILALTMLVPMCSGFIR